MPEYLAPGVYVEEVDAQIKPIEGVSTSTGRVARVLAPVLLAAALAIRIARRRRRPRP